MGDQPPAIKNGPSDVHQPRVLDRSRFGEGPLTALTAEEMAAVEKSLLGVV